MDYIINPMWFYWLHVVNIIGGVCVAAALVSGVAVTVFAICDHIEGEDEHKKLVRKLTIIFVITMVGAIFIPDKTTMISMMVAKLTTVTNVNITVDAIKDIVDYIVQAIQNI